MRGLIIYIAVIPWAAFLNIVHYHYNHLFLGACITTRIKRICKRIRIAQYILIAIQLSAFIYYLMKI